MFNMGGGELFLVLLVAVIIVPADKLPGVATSVGRFLAQIKNMMGEFQKGINQSLKEETKKIISKPSESESKKEEK